MSVAIFYDASGAIVSFSPFEAMTPDEIADATPAGGGYLVEDNYPDADTQWVDGGVLTDRPVITTATDWDINDDGIDSVWFEAPAGTEVLVTPAGSDILLNASATAVPTTGLVVLTSTIAGDYDMTVDAPFPYQDTVISVTVGFVNDTPITPPGSPATTLTISLTLAAPEGLSVLDKPKFNKVAWDESEDPRHAFYELTRYESEDDADDDENGTTIGPILENFYKDADELEDDEYWYRVNDVDVEGNRSPKSEPASVMARGVQTGDIDQTPPAAPAAPTLTQTAKDVDEDGKIDISVKATWTAVTDAKSYELEITQGSDVSYVKTKRLSHIFKAKSGKLYSVKVAAISFAGESSAFSSATTITPSKKSALPATPGGLTATAKAKAIRVSWTAASEADFKWARIYRNTTNNADTATEIGRTKADWYRDDDELSAATTYYYWVAFVDTSGNEGAKSSSASAVYRGVQTGDIDQTPPAAPTLSLAGYGDFDKDGSIDSGLMATITNPNTGVEIGGYVLHVQRADTSGGAYADWGKFDVVAEDVADSLTTIWGRQANARKWFRARVRAVAKVSGKKGPWSGFTAGVQPSTATGYAGSTPPAPSVVAIANGYRYSWSLGSLDASIYKETEILVDGVSLKKVSGTSAEDMTTRTVGAKPTITLKQYDKVGGATNVSSGVVAPAFRAATSSEIGAGAVLVSNTDQTVLAAPSGLSLAVATQGLGPDGTLITTIKATWNALSGAAQYRVQFEQSDNGSSGWAVVANPYTSALLEAITVVPGKYYRAYVAAINAFGKEGTPSAYVSYQPPGNTPVPADPALFQAFPTPNGWYVAWQAPTEKNYDYTEIGFFTNPNGPFLDTNIWASSKYNRAIVYRPYQSGYPGVRHVNKAGLKSNWVVSSGMITPEQLARAGIAPGAAGATAETNTGTSGGSVNAGAGTSTVLIWTFKCTSNTSGVSISLGSNSWTVDFKDQQPFTFVSRENSGGSFSASKSGGGSFTGGRLAAITIY